MVKESIINLRMGEYRVAHVISPKVFTLPIDITSSSILGNCNCVCASVSLIKVTKGLFAPTNYRILPLRHQLILSNALASLDFRHLPQGFIHYFTPPLEVVSEA